jgi:hypothetical protein
MRVYNIGTTDVTYKGRDIPPNGGSVEIPDMAFVPDRDRALTYLSFGSLPKGWEPKRPVAPPPAAVIQVAVVDTAIPEAQELKVEAKPLDESAQKDKKDWKKK